MNLYDVLNKYWESWANHAINVYNEVMETIDSSIFEKYRIFENAGNDEETSHALIFLQRLAVLCIEKEDIKNMLFDSSYHVTPTDLYQFSYYLNYVCLFADEDVQKLFRIATDILNSISDRSIIEDPFIPTEVEIELSEDEIFDILTSISENLVVSIIGKLDIGRHQKQDIKRLILSNDLNGFIEYSITNSIDFTQIENICYSLILKNYYKEILNQLYGHTVDVLPKDLFFLPEWNDKKLFELIADRAPVLARETNTLTKIASEEEAIRHALSVPQDIALDSLWKLIYILIILTKQLRELCPNNDLIDERDRLIQSDPLLQSVEERFLFVNVDTLPHFIIPTLDEFKNRYISEIELPPSCNVKKNSGAFFNGDKMWTDRDIFILYKLLTEAGILSWDEATCFSFMYRMSRLYKPSEESVHQLLRPICWNGKTSELIALIFFFQEGDTRMWVKSKTFFCQPNNELIKIPSGAKNCASTISDRMNNILSNKCFKR